MPSPILIIRSSQMVLLGDMVDSQFVDGLVEQFSSAYPGPGNRERVISVIGRARGYAISAREAVEWFVNLDFLRGYEWEKVPEMEGALDILDDAAVDAAGRQFRLEKWLRRWDGDAG